MEEEGRRRVVVIIPPSSAHLTLKFGQNKAILTRGCDLVDAKTTKNSSKTDFWGNLNIMVLFLVAFASTKT